MSSFFSIIITSDLSHMPGGGLPPPSFTPQEKRFFIPLAKATFILFIIKAFQASMKVHFIVPTIVGGDAAKLLADIIQTEFLPSDESAAPSK